MALGKISGPMLVDNLIRNDIDLAFDTDLLYLDVVNGRIGIHTDGPAYTLDVVGTTNYNSLTVTTATQIADIRFATNTISNDIGNIYFHPDQTTNPTIATNNLHAGNIEFVNESINGLVLDNNINLQSNGLGQVVFTTSKLNVNGDLHATGNITWDGTITFGDSDTDSVDFNADFTSNIVPDAPNTYNLGSPTKPWNALYTETVDSADITSSTLIVNNIDFLTTPGEIWYVSKNGNDSNTGSHPHDTFLTIKQALSVAQSGDTVYVYAGTYQEEFPLTVPQGVAISGQSIRECLVQPTAPTSSNDAFLLNGETTVENLTIRNYFYNSLTDTGYGFRFANGAKVTSRSPYIRNLTVLNTESTVGAGDAGRGAIADGSVVDANSREASLLFHAVTFIISNADGITATNGARVEWLNSFTYFAYRGIHLTEGSLGFAGLGLKFGAEMRSINSANVYGTYGAVADGPSTLGYLIGHNFGYVGSGLDLTNDPRLVIQANEIVATNGGKLYYDSMDHKGDYRVGDIFYVSQETGRISFTAQRIDFSAQGSIVLEGVGGITIVDATGIQNSNIRIHDNNIDSLSGPVNFSAISGNTYLNTNVFVTGNTNISADGLIKGNVILGNQTTDTVKFYDYLTETIEPKLNNTYTLGSDNGVNPKRWRTMYLSGLNIDAILGIDNNTISTLAGNNDLRFVAAGTGKVIISSTDVQVDNNLTVSGTSFTVNGATSLQDTEITGTVTHVGNYTQQTGNAEVVGTTQTNNIVVTNTGSYLVVPDIKFINNEIQATITNDDIKFYGTGTGGVVVDQRLKFKDSEISNVWASPTNDTEKSIIFQPNGTGNVVIDDEKSITIPAGNNTNRTLSAYGEIRKNTTHTWYEGYLPSGNISFNNLYDFDKNTYIIPELTPGAGGNTLQFGINGSVRGTIDPTKLFTYRMDVDNFQMSGNTVHNSVSGSDTYLTPDGTADVDINGILVNTDNITNQLNSPISLVSTGNGYIKFSGTGAVRFPVGTDAERRLTPELGEVRYSTQRNYMEVFNGTTWIPAVGTLGAAPLSDVLEIMDTWSLILG